MENARSCNPTENSPQTNCESGFASIINANYSNLLHKNSSGYALAREQQGNVITSVQLAQETVKGVAERLHTQFAKALFDALAADSAKDGEASYKILMLMVGEILATNHQTKAIGEQILTDTGDLLVKAGENEKYHEATWERLDKVLVLVKERLELHVQSDEKTVSQGGSSTGGGIPGGSDMPPDVVQLLLYAFINQSNILILDDYPDMRCVYIRSQYFGWEYCPQYIRDCAEDDHPKRNPPDARVERLRWLTVLETMELRGLVHALSKNSRKEVYSLTSYGRRRANEIIQWRQEHSPRDVPVPSMF